MLLHQSNTLQYTFLLSWQLSPLAPTYFLTNTSRLNMHLFPSILKMNMVYSIIQWTLAIGSSLPLTCQLQERHFRQSISMHWQKDGMRLSISVPLHLLAISDLPISFISFLNYLNVITSCGWKLVDNKQLWPLQQNKENQLQLFSQT